MPITRLPDPHDYPLAHRCAEHLRHEAIDDFWRGANAVLERVFPSTTTRQARSRQRLQSRLHRRRPALIGLG